MKFQNTAFMIALLALMACQASASAIISNGDFASGDFANGHVPPDWIKTGNAEVQTSAGLFGSPNPPATHHAILGTGTISNELRGGDAVSASNLESFTVLSGGGTLLENNQKVTGQPDCLTCTVGSGSAIQTIFTAAAGSQLSFDWNFITNTNVPRDMAFWVLDQTFHFLANTQSTLVKSDSNLLLETGYQTNSFSISTSGQHTLSFGIVDGTPSGGSALALTNVQVGAIRLPTAFWLFLSGIVGVFKYARQPNRVRHV